MRRILILMALFAVGVASGQTIHLDGSFGVNRTWMSGLTKTKALTTVRVGVMPFYEYPLDNGHILEAGLGLFYVNKGAMIDPVVESKLKIDYIHFPLTVRYFIPVWDEIKVAPYLGWWWAYGLSAMATSGVGGVETDAFSYDSMWLRRGDTGLSIGAMVAYEELLFSLGYEVGVRNLHRFSGGRLTNTSFVFQLSYRIF